LRRVKLGLVDKRQRVVGSCLEQDVLVGVFDLGVTYAFEDPDERHCLADFESSTERSIRGDRDRDFQVARR